MFRAASRSERHRPDGARRTVCAWAEQVTPAGRERRGERCEQALCNHKRNVVFTANHAIALHIPQ
eukprot:scaffold23495_cov112-Isochrysis_galbana.AAC.9